MEYTVSVFENKIWEGDFPERFFSQEEAIKAIEMDWQSQSEGVVYMISNPIKVVEMKMVKDGMLQPYSFEKDGK